MSFSQLSYRYSTDGLFGSAMLNMEKKESPVEDPNDKKKKIMTQAKDYTPSLDLSLTSSPAKDLMGGIELKGVDYQKMTATITCKGSYTSGPWWAGVVMGNKLEKDFKMGKKPTYSFLGAFKQSDAMSYGAKYAKRDDKGTLVNEISGSAQYTPTKETTIRLAGTYNLTTGKPKIETGVSHAFTKGCTVVTYLGPSDKGETVMGLQVNLES